MSYFFGTDNPYRAPKVARDVASFQGAFQEVARIEPPKADVLDFFYQGVQSYEQMFAKQKQSYENKANELMAEIEDQKAKDIMSGMTSEEVNKRYSEGYMALAGSGRINKNLDAFKVLTSNNLKARGAVVGDVADDMLAQWRDEIARAGHSYTDRQRITEEFRRKTGYGKTQVGEIFDQEALPVLRQAQAEQSRAEITRATNSIVLSATQAVTTATQNPDSRNEYVRAVFDPNQGPVPPITDEDGNISLEALQMMGNSIYETQFKPLMEDATPEQQAFMEYQGRAAAEALAFEVLNKKKQDDHLADREQEQLQTVSDFGALLSDGGRMYSELSLTDLAEAGSISPQEMFASSMSAAAKSVLTSDSNPAAFMREVWGTGETAFYKQAIAAAEASDNPTEALANLASAFPKDVSQAYELGYVPKGTTPEQWKAISDQFAEPFRATLATRGTAAAIAQLHSLQRIDPNAAMQALPEVEKSLKRIASNIGVNLDTIKTWDPNLVPESSASIMREGLAKVSDIVNGTLGTGKSKGGTAGQERLLTLGSFGLSGIDLAAMNSAAAETRDTGKAGAPVDPQASGAAVSKFLAGSLAVNSTGDVRGDATTLVISLTSFMSDQNAGRSGIVNSTPVFERSLGVAQSVAMSELAEAHPNEAKGTIHGSLVTEFAANAGDYRPGDSDELGLVLRERLGVSKSSPIDETKWIGTPENQAYSWSFLKQAEANIIAENPGIENDDIRLREELRNHLQPMLGEDGFDRIRQAAVYGKHSVSGSDGTLVISEGKEQAALDAGKIQNQITVETRIKSLTGGTTRDFVQGVLDLWRSDDALSGDDAIKMQVGQKTLEYSENSSFVSSDSLIEMAAVDGWGANDADTRLNIRRFAEALENDPVAKDVYQDIVFRKLVNANFNNDLLDGDQDALAIHYAQAATEAAAEMMKDYGLKDGGLERFSDGGLDKETHAWIISGDGIPDSFDRDEFRGQSAFLGNLDEWGKGFSDQEYEDLGTIELDGRPVSLGKSAAAARQMLRSFKVDSGDGRGEIPFVDFIMTDENGKVDNKAVTAWRVSLQEKLNSGARNSLQTNLYAMVEAATKVGKLGADQDLVGLTEVDFAEYVASTGDTPARLISDSDSPSGYSLQVAGIVSIPWEAPKASFGRRQEGRKWPDFIRKGAYRPSDTFYDNMIKGQMELHKQRKAQEQRREDAASAAFGRVDSDNDGVLSASEIAAFEDSILRPAGAIDRFFGVKGKRPSGVPRFKEGETMEEALKRLGER